MEIKGEDDDVQAELNVNLDFIVELSKTGDVNLIFSDDDDIR